MTGIILSYATCLVAGIAIGAYIERLSWWRRGHRDENPEER